METKRVDRRPENTAARSEFWAGKGQIDRRVASGRVGGVWEGFVRETTFCVAGHGWAWRLWFLMLGFWAKWWWLCDWYGFEAVIEQCGGVDAIGETRVKVRALGQKWKNDLRAEK